MLRIAGAIAKAQAGPCAYDGTRAPIERLLGPSFTGACRGVRRRGRKQAVRAWLEDYVVGSFEFFSHYALTRKKLLCLDMGHFHPTETIADKLSALLQFHERLLLHVSRPIRWDSDHVVIFNDDLRAVFTELVRGNALDRVTVALDYFDASINRIAAYVIGIRATRKAILWALPIPPGGSQSWKGKASSVKSSGLWKRPRRCPSEQCGTNCADAPKCQWGRHGSKKWKSTRRALSGAALLGLLDRLNSIVRALQ